MTTPTHRVMTDAIEEQKMRNGNLRTLSGSG